MTLKLDLLGSPHGYLNNKRLTEYKFKKAFALLCYLIVEQKPITRLKLASIFWPEHGESNGLMNLRRALATLKKQVGEYVVSNYHEVRFNGAAPYKLDLEKLIDDKLFKSQEDLENFIALHRGEFMEGFYLRKAEPFEKWALTQASQFRERFSKRLTKAAQEFDNRKQYQLAIRCGRKLLEIDPLREAVHQDLIRWYVQVGETHHAIQQFKSCESILYDAFGISPSQSTIKWHNIALQADTPIFQKQASTENKIPLFGRKREWADLVEFWENGNRSKASIVLIRGEAGSGKTRLAEELVQAVEKQKISVDYTRSYAARDDSFTPIINLLRSRIPLSAFKLEDVWLVELSRIFPELLTDHPTLAAPQTIKESWQLHRFYEALVRCFQLTPGPKLIHFDDLQWCDSESLNWLRFLLGYKHKEQLLIVGTVRDDEIEADHPLNMMHYDLQQRDQSRVIDLSPLNSNELQSMATHILGHSLSDGDLTNLSIETEGSPLYALELLRSKTFLSNDQSDPNLGIANQPQRQLPQKIHSIIQWRFGLLSLKARNLIETAAIIGRSFSLDFLSTVNDREEVDILQSLDELWKRRIIREVGDDEFDFFHDYFRDAAHDEISPINRRRIHNQVATALKAFYKDQLDSVCGQIANHLVNAGKPQQAIEFFIRAGEYAGSRHASDEALQNFKSALDLLPQTELSARFELHLKRDEVFTQMANMEAWGNELEILNKLSKKLLDNDKSNIGPTVEYLLRKSLYETVFTPTDISTTYIRQAIYLANKHRLSYQEARGHRIYGSINLTRSNFKQASKSFQKAIDLAKRNNFLKLEAIALEHLAVVSMFSGAHPDLMEGYIRRVLSHSKQLKDIYLEASCYNKLGYLRVAQGESNLDSAEQYYLEGLNIARGQKFAMLESLIGGNLVILYILIGDYERAENSLNQAVEIAGKSGFRYFKGARSNYAAFMHLNMGDYEKSKVFQQQAIDILIGENRLAWLCRAYSDMGFMEFLKGNFEISLSYLDRALKTIDQIGDNRQRGTALRRKGQLFIKMGRFDEAKALFLEAYEIHQSLIQPNYAMMAIAGLTELFVAEANLPAALEQADKVFTYLEANRFDCTDESLSAYMATYETFKLAGDSRASRMLEKAVNQLRKRGNSIRSGTAQTIFWGVNLHANVLAEWQKVGAQQVS